MSYKVDRVYDSMGTEISNVSHTTSLAGANHFEYDGRYIWVTCAGGIAIYEWWGAASDNEPAFEALDELIYPRYDYGLTKKLRLVTFITITATEQKRTTQLESMAEEGHAVYPMDYGVKAYFKSTPRTGVALAPYFIKKCQTKMYVTNGASFGEIFEFDIATQKLVRQIDVRETYQGNTVTHSPGGTFVSGSKYLMKSNLVAINGKLWFSGTAFGDTVGQHLYAYDVNTNTMTATVIPTRPSIARRWLTPGYNGYIYITDPNNVSISKFSDVDASFVSTIRTNAFPTYIFCGPDRRIWVSSFGGMLTLVDSDDDGVHNDWSVGTGDARAQSLQVMPNDTSKIWFVDNNQLLVRHDLNTHEQLELGSSEDWHFSNPKINSPEQLWMNQMFYFQDATLTTHQVKPYLFLLQDNKLVAFKLDRYLYRETFAELNGQGAVVEGALQYFGE